MKLRYITCSDPREFNDIHDIVKLGQMSPRVEIAVQAHPSKMSYRMPRNEWFHELLCYVIRDNIDINLAVHVNREWCDEICCKGKIPQELREFFYLHKKNNAKYLIGRWQLNIPKETVQNINYSALKKLLRSNENKEFILQYNDITRSVPRTLYREAPFSLLYDASGGRGVAPKRWNAPVYSNVPQGYSGGMSPENVADNLSKISSVTRMPIAYHDENNQIVYQVRERDDIWIDAEGKLKTDDKFDIARAQQYVLNAENWLQKQR